MITFDAKIFLGDNDQGTTCVIMAVLHYYVPSGNPDPEDGRIYSLVENLHLLLTALSSVMTMWVQLMMQ